MSEKKLTVLITGASSGIGAAVAACFLAGGHTVYAMDIDKPSVRERQISLEADITDEKALLAIKETMMADGVVLDAILNIAGVHAMVSLAEGDFSKMKRLIDINLCGTMLVNRVFHSLLAPRGRILIVTSEVASFAPLPFNGLYNVSKTALDAYAQALRQELNLLGQKVITVRPGAIETPLAQGSMVATEVLAENTVLYQKQASRFARIARKFMGIPMKAEKLGMIIFRAVIEKHPRMIYQKHRNIGLVLLGILPIRLQCFIIKLLLGG